MFGINLSEWLLIIVVGFVVIGPKELPVVIRHIAGFIRELRAFTHGVREQLHEVAREAGLDDIINGTSTIIDLEGKPQKAYDVNQIKALTYTSSPRGEDGRGAETDSSLHVSTHPNPPPEGEGNDSHD